MEDDTSLGRFALVSCEYFPITLTPALTVDRTARACPSQIDRCCRLRQLSAGLGLHAVMHGVLHSLAAMSVQQHCIQTRERQQASAVSLSLSHEQDLEAGKFTPGGTCP